MRLPRFSRLRFSLLTLLLFTAWLGSGVALCVRGFAPWRCVRRLETAKPGSYKPDNYRITLAVLSHDTKWLFAAGEDSRLRLFDTRNGELLWNVPFTHWFKVSNFHDAQFIDHDRVVEIVGGYRHGSIFIEATTGKVIDDLERERTLLHPDNDWPLVNQRFGTAYAPDQSRHAIRVVRDPMSESGWDLRGPEGKVIASIKSPNGWPWGVAFSPDNLRFATASYDNTVNIRDKTDGHLLTTIVPEPKTWCYGVSFSDDGNELVIARFHDVFIYQKQFSETPWGILERPEIWACAGCFVLWLARVLLRVFRYFKARANHSAAVSATQSAHNFAS